ncbi:MAG: septal ring lytic transglycosylase RlpA family protein [Desulfovibrio sp.]|nr:septal ring lytic transglycosylase RlpA family protein [Desulfovibrio sp.]
MTYLRLLTLSLCLLFGMALVAPVTDCNAKSANRSHVSRSKDKKSQGRSARSHASRTKHHQKGNEVISSRKEDSPSLSSRDVWLENAKSGKTFGGLASWYGSDFHGGATASGVNYDMYTFTAAHRTLPIGTVVKVTDRGNGKSVMVCVTDRGPYAKGRVIDLSYAAANQLNMRSRGIGHVDLEVVSDEKGTPLLEGQAYFIRYNAAHGMEKVGPFAAFADAAAMHEALRQAHPEAEVVLDSFKN